MLNSLNLVVVKAQELKLAEDAHAARDDLQLIVIQQKLRQCPVGTAKRWALYSVVTDAVVG